MAKDWLPVSGQKQDQHHWDQFPLCSQCVLSLHRRYQFITAPLWGLPTKRLISPKSCGFLKQTHDTEARTTSSLLTSHKMCIRGKWCSAHKTEVKGSVSITDPLGQPVSLFTFLSEKIKDVFTFVSGKAPTGVHVKWYFLVPHLTVLDSSQGRKAIASSPAVRMGTC